jgi:glycosyltransferase involved in cell wall biosynthesis
LGAQAIIRSNKEEKLNNPEAVRYSIVIPLYNERENIIPLYNELRETMEKMGASFECVFVDDASGDGSASLLRDVALHDGRVTVVSLRKNSGKSAALCAGFSVALGDFIITMDGDLQHNPADLPLFTEKLEDGFDIVCGWRQRRTEGSAAGRLLGRWANWIIARLSGVPIHDFGGGFKAYRRELVSQIPLYGELQRFIPLFAFQRGCTICEVPLTVRARERGVSKYGFAEKIPFLFDLMTARFLLKYLSRPMHFFGTAGLIAGFSGGAIAVALLVRLLSGVHVFSEHGPLLIFAAVLIVCGVQLFALGLVAEMLVRHFHERNDRGSLYNVTGERHGQKEHREAARDQQTPTYPRP